MEQEITIDDLRDMARSAGLKLSDDELERLLPGVNRSKRQAAELRELITLDTEPAGTFKAPSHS
jgi:Ca2+-binding EF-hand superfamily protein